MANWQEHELLLTLHLYCRTPFGRLDHRNPDFIQLADVIGRTSSLSLERLVTITVGYPKLKH